MLTYPSRLIATVLKCNALIWGGKGLQITGSNGSWSLKASFCFSSWQSWFTLETCRIHLRQKRGCRNHDKLIPWQILGQIMSLVGEFHTYLSILSTKKGKSWRLSIFLYSFWLVIPSECLNTQGKVWISHQRAWRMCTLSHGTGRTSWAVKSVLEFFNKCVPSQRRASVFFRLQY